MSQKKEVDICIITEGSYPYVVGGVSQWAHELIQEHQERTFHILTLLPENPDLTFRYDLPKNVISNSVTIVQRLDPGSFPIHTPKETWEIIEKTIKGLVSSKMFHDFKPLLEFFRKYQSVLGKRILTESKESWDFLMRLYHDLIPKGPFKSYFASAFTICRSLYSVILPELPEAHLYHAVCTGYAGFMLYRAKQEKNAPCIITEHGIYSNERRIEIAAANWIVEMGSLNLALEDRKTSLKDFWLNTFLSLAHAAYISCDEVISTFDGNHELQIAGGADPQKIHTIVHGINLDEYAPIKEARKGKTPNTIAFIGRIVPIKDIKTFIWACHIVKKSHPDIQLLAIGPTEEDPAYFSECLALVAYLGLEKELIFTGRVDVKEYFHKIDLVVLTSISETQPLIMLEAGAAGIPSVAPDIGACHQLLYGHKNEEPKLGQAGIITPLVDPEATAAAIIRMMTDRNFYEQCSDRISKRMLTYYNSIEEHKAYRTIYKRYIS